MNRRLADSAIQAIVDGLQGMWIVKAWDGEVWGVVAMCPSLDDANFEQDRVWLATPDVLTEVEYRGF